MNLQEQIQVIESKIVEVKNTLQIWTENITNYQTTLNQITNQLEQIKNQIKPNGILK